MKEKILKFVKGPSGKKYTAFIQDKKTQSHNWPKLSTNIAWKKTK